MKKVGTIVSIFLLILILLLISGVAFWKMSSREQKIGVVKEIVQQPLVKKIIAEEVKDDYQEKVQDTEFNEQEVAVDEVVESRLSGYNNIALFGVDSQDGSFDKATRSDAIMIVSINNDTGAVKMVSLYRDTYLKIIDDDKFYYDKVNAAYNNGGIKTAISTLNTNLDLNISDYVVVNFNGLTEIIDSMGGMDVTITEVEMRRINKISSDMTEGTEIEYVPLEEYGNVHLNGLQTTAYCRIRDAAYTDDEGNEYYYDFGRTARQRSIIQKIVNKVKSGGVSEIIKLAKNVMDMNSGDKTFIKMSLGYQEIIDLIPVLIDYKMEGSSGFPYTIATPNIKGEDLVVAEGLTYNVEKLHEFLFGEDDYKPSDTVEEISKYIMEYTGIAEVRIDE